jgi:hypothetical protein
MIKMLGLVTLQPVGRSVRSLTEADDLPHLPEDPSSEKGDPRGQQPPAPKASKAQPEPKQEPQTVNTVPADAQTVTKQVSYTPLQNDPGTAFLLTLAIDNAKKNNTMSSLAYTFAQKLNISNSSDLDAFKESTQNEFASIDGYADLLDSLKQIVPKDEQPRKLN